MRTHIVCIIVMRFKYIVNYLSYLYIQCNNVCTIVQTYIQKIDVVYTLLNLFYIV
jgi:hypothetical protein